MCACDFNYTCSVCRETRADDLWVDWQEPDPEWLGGGDE